jgi:hypothetical protein
MAKHQKPIEGVDHVVKAQQTPWLMTGYMSICTLATDHKKNKDNIPRSPVLYDKLEYTVPIWCFE